MRAARRDDSVFSPAKDTSVPGCLDVEVETQLSCTRQSVLTLASSTLFLMNRGTRVNRRRPSRHPSPSPRRIDSTETASVGVSRARLVRNRCQDRLPRPLIARRSGFRVAYSSAASGCLEFRQIEIQQRRAEGIAIPTTRLAVRARSEGNREQRNEGRAISTQRVSPLLLVAPSIDAPVCLIAPFAAIQRA